MAFLDKTGLQTVTNRLVQGDAIKVASHRGRNVKTIIDNITRECTNVPTPLEYKIENRVNEFKVGQGRDVDASGDVEVGYTEVELQGKTWQNVKGVLKSFTSTGVTILENGDIKVNTSRDWLVDYEAPTLKPNTTYTFIVDLVNVTPETITIIGILGGGGWNISYTHRSSGRRIFKLTTKDENITATGIRVRNASSYKAVDVFIKNLLILEGDYTQTPVEELPQYFEGIQSSFEDGVVAVRSGEQEYTASIGEPLRSLPNGTSDEIRCSNGHWELVRRIGTYTFKGNENWIKDVDLTDYKECKMYTFDKALIGMAQKSKGACICNTLKEEGYYGTVTPFSFCNDAGAWMFNIIMPASIGTGAKLKEWLVLNGTMLQFELAEPTTTPIEPIKFETQPLGSITINSEIPPTSFHTVQLNRAAQIERGITEIAELKNRVEILETMYDSHFLETAHKLGLLGMDYELESEEF